MKGLIGLLCAVGVLVASSQTAPSQPNIIIFLVDDMGVMDTSLPFLTDEAGKPKRYPLNDYYRTPNMERLAGRGIRRTVLRSPPGLDDPGEDCEDVSRRGRRRADVRRPLHAPAGRSLVDLEHNEFTLMQNRQRDSVVAGLAIIQERDNGCFTRPHARRSQRAGSLARQLRRSLAGRSDW
jgi:hypothetical protein